MATKKTMKANTKVKQAVKKAPRAGEVVGYGPTPARDMTLGVMIAWMQGCMKHAKCEDKRSQAEIRRNYGQIVEALKWAKARGYTVPMKEVLRDVGA